MNPAAPESPRFSVIVPVLNEIGELPVTLRSVEAAAEAVRLDVERIVVDGGSTDGTWEWLQEQDRWRVMRSARGRARQMNAGAAAARGAWLLFLHADTHLTARHFQALAADASAAGDAALAFEIEFRGDGKFYRWMERGVNWRSRRLGLPYGDQALSVPRHWFDALGGFRGEPHLEDLDFVLRLRSRGRRFRILQPPVRTSIRQWERVGKLRGLLNNGVRMTGACFHHFAGGEHLRLRRGLPVFPCRQEVD